MFSNTGITAHATKHDLELFDAVNYVLRKTYKFLCGHPHRQHFRFECHPITRAIGAFVRGLRVVDGDYLGLERVEKDEIPRFRIRYASHSWLETPDDAIIDPYPAGFLSDSALFATRKGLYAFSGGNCYVQNAEVTKAIAGRQLSRKAHVLIDLIEQALAK